jgi:hypothetical protein
MQAAQQNQVQVSFAPTPLPVNCLPHYITQNPAIIELIVEICSDNFNLIPITTEGNLATFAVSEDGLQLLHHQTGLNEVALLQFAMAKDELVDDLTKTRLLFGLLLRRGGLRVIKEDGKIIAPIPELCVTVAPLAGEVSFPRDLVKTSKLAPNLQSVCQLKTQCVGRRAHQLIQFILDKLTTLPVEETLLAPLGPFRLKSYSSVINKLFYRGKGLTDLLAATVANDIDLRTLLRNLNELGATMVGQPEEDGNGDLTYRFVRIIRVELRESPPAFFFPVYYEVVKLHHHTPVSHKQYEWTRLRFSLGPGDMITMEESGFTAELIDLGTSPSIDAQLAPQRPQTDNDLNPALGERSLAVCLSSHPPVAHPHETCSPSLPCSLSASPDRISLLPCISSVVVETELPSTNWSLWLTMKMLCVWDTSCCCCTRVTQQPGFPLTKRERFPSPETLSLG